MVHLIWKSSDFGISSTAEVKAVYNTLEEAQRQGEHDLKLGRHPLRIEDADTGKILWRVDA